MGGIDHPQTSFCFGHGHLAQSSQGAKRLFLGHGVPLESPVKALVLRVSQLEQFPDAPMARETGTIRHQS